MIFLTMLISLDKVECGRDCFFLFASIVRGDGGTITIGDRTNVQDGAVIHADPLAPAIIGSDVSIGHGACVHGCTVGDACIIGINSTVLNGAKIGAGSIIAAGAVVPENMEIPENSLVVGIPAKVVRTTPSLRQRCQMNADAYQGLKEQYEKVKFEIKSRM